MRRFLIPMLTAALMALAPGRYSVAAHTQGKLSLGLKHPAISLLRSHHGHVSASLLLAPGSGRTRTVDTRLALHRG
jgi:hypothetical protein